MVDQAGGVGYAQSMGNLLGQFQSLNDRQCALLAAQIGQFVGQRRARKVVDDGVGEAVVGDVQVADNGDGRVFDLRDGLHAAAETGGQVLVLVGRRPQHLQKNQALQLDVTREEQITGFAGRDV